MIKSFKQHNLNSPFPRISHFPGKDAFAPALRLIKRIGEICGLASINIDFY